MPNTVCSWYERKVVIMFTCLQAACQFCHDDCTGIFFPKVYVSSLTIPSGEPGELPTG